MSSVPDNFERTGLHLVLLFKEWRSRQFLIINPTVQQPVCDQPSPLAPLGGFNKKWEIRKDRGRKISAPHLRRRRTSRGHPTGRGAAAGAALHLPQHLQGRDFTSHSPSSPISRRMSLTPNKGDQFKFRHYNQGPCHDTEGCERLKEEIERFMQLHAKETPGSRPV